LLAWLVFLALARPGLPAFSWASLAVQFLAVFFLIFFVLRSLDDLIYFDSSSLM